MSVMTTQQTLCESMQIIAKELIGDLKFDKTIVCTVVDASTREQGYVTVSDGNMKFKAYGEGVAAVNGTQFYVTIPQGDYSQRAIIKEKYEPDKKMRAEKYENPLEHMVLKKQLQSANGATVGIAKQSTVSLADNLLFDDESNLCLPLYDRLVINCDFMCPLNDYYVKSGEYGLILGFVLNGATKPYYLYLKNTDSMFGNTYAFDTPYKQEFILDISNLVNDIEKISLSLYSFGDFTVLDNNNVIQPYNGDEQITINNLSVHIGKSTQGYSSGTLNLYTLQPVDYSAQDATRFIGSLWYNYDDQDKQIGFSDLNKYDYYYAWSNYTKEKGWQIIAPQQKFQNESEREENKIYEFLYELTQDANPSVQVVLNTAYPQDLIKLILKRRPKKTYCKKCEQLFDKCSCDENEREEFGRYNGIEAGSYALQDLELNPFTEYTDQITFSNLEADNDMVRYDEATALSIELGEGSTEAYTFYGENGSITKEVEASRKRTVKASYKPQFIQNKTNMVGAEIMWKIPTASTMLVRDQSIEPPDYEDLRARCYPTDEEIESGATKLFSEFITEEEFNAASYDKLFDLKYENGDDVQYTKLELIQKFREPNEFDKFYEDTEYGLYVYSKIIKASNPDADMDKQTAIAADLEFRYQVKEYYLKAYDKNIIQCFLNLEPENENVEGAKIRAEQKFLFSSFGSNGTNYTFIIEEEYLAMQQVQVSDGYTYEGPVKRLTPKVYDISGNLVEGLIFKYKNHTATSYSEINGTYVDIPIGAEFSLTYEHITFQTNVDWVGKNTNITTIHPLVFSRGSQYSSNAPTKIYYDHTGRLKIRDFDELKLYKNEQEITYCNWFFLRLGNDGYSYSSTGYGDLELLKEDFQDDSGRKKVYLQVPSTYAEGAEGDKFALCAAIREGGATAQMVDVYVAPLILIQDKNSSPILNEWGGNSTVGTETDATKGEISRRVSSASFIAGKKNFTENTFSGVIMGDIDEALGESTTRVQGLFGFQDGVGTFALTVDGKLALGKTGKGQIEFNGDTGIIKSADGTGMTINLAEGSIHADNFKLTGSGLLLQNKASAEDIYPTVFQVGGLRYDYLEDSSGQPIVSDFYINGAEKGLHYNAMQNIFTIGSGFSYWEEYPDTGLPRLVIGKNAVSTFTMHRSSTPDTEIFLGGWSVGEDGLYREVNGQITAGLFIEYDNEKLKFNDRLVDGPWTILVGVNNNEFNFGVTCDGQMYAKNAKISGTINADYGTIGSWQILDDGHGAPTLYGSANYEQTQNVIGIPIYQQIILAPWGIRVNYEYQNQTSGGFTTEQISWAELIKRIIMIGDNGV